MVWFTESIKVMIHKKGGRQMEGNKIGNKAVTEEMLIADGYRKYSGTTKTFVPMWEIVCGETVLYLK